MILEKIGFEKYNHNLWVMWDYSKNIKYFATFTKLKYKYKYFIKDVYLNEVIATDDEKDLYDFFLKEQRDNKIDSIINYNPK